MLAALPLPPNTGARRSELQALHDHLTTHIEALDQHVKSQADERPQARRLMTHPGVGLVSGLSPRLSLRRAKTASRDNASQLDRSVKWKRVKDLRGKSKMSERWISV